MGKIYTALGLMSGTSGDGIDASIIQTDGETYYKVLENKFFKYSSQVSSEIHKSKQEFLNQTDNFNLSKDWRKFSKNLSLFEEKITNLHADASNNLIKRFSLDLIGFHGQTIFHDPEKRITDNGQFIVGATPESDLAIVTNRAWLEQSNDERSRLRVIDPEYISEFVDRFEELINRV